MERRTFLKWVTNGFGVLFAAILGIPAVAFLLDSRHRKAKEGTFRTVARLSELQKLGPDQPMQAVIHDVRKDAWTMHPNDLIGRVWLVWRGDKNVDAYTTICPHLGCSVNLKPDKSGFLCPCHGGNFDLHGKRLSDKPAPRDMDSLQVKLEPDPEAEGDSLIQVEYQNFYQNQPRKVARV